MDESLSLCLSNKKIKKKIHDYPCRGEVSGKARREVGFWWVSCFPGNVWTWGRTPPPRRMMFLGREVPPHTLSQPQQF